MIKLLTIVTLSILCISACTSESTSNPEIKVKVQNTMTSEGQYDAIAQNLESCEVYSETFTHMMIKDTLERRVLGLQNEKCVFEEDMPSNGLLRCEYSQTERVAMANYYRSITPNSTLSSTDKNPLSDALASGTCVISGY